MIHLAAQIIEVLAALGAVFSIAYYGLCLRSAFRFRRQNDASRNVHATHLPPVSILKPLRGGGSAIYECLRSHCPQDYPEYEIIFGVSDAEDPAAELVRRLQSEYPQRPIRLVICRKQLGANQKVSNLAQMLPEAIYDHLVVNDGDIRVESDYLRSIIAPLADPAIGMVTCLYRGVPASTLGSRMESLGISTDFAAGALVARDLEGIRFGLGSTLAFRRRQLETMGGFEAVVDYLADDYEIGNRIAAQGLDVRLSGTVVETCLPAYSIREFLSHQLRWARTIRDVRRWGYLGMVCTFGVPWALLALLVSAGAAWAWCLLLAVLAMRIATAAMVGSVVLQDRHVVPNLWLLPFRDVLGLLVWMASFAGHTVAWHGDSFTLKNGKLARTSP